MEERLRVARLIWSSILVSSAVFLGVLFVLERPSEVEPETALGLAMAALVNGVISFVLPAKLHQQALRAAGLQVSDQADPGASDVLPYRDAPRRRVFADPKRARSAALNTYQTSMILGMGLAEATALFGFMLGFMGGPISYVVPAFVLAWISMLSKFPTPSKVIAPLERTYGATLS